MTKATPFVRLGAAGHACTETFADVPDRLCSVSVMNCMWIVVGSLVRCAMVTLTHAGPKVHSMITEGLEGLQSAKEKFCSDLKFKILAKGIGDRKTLSAVKREHCDALTASRKGWLLCLGHTNHVLIRGLLQLARPASDSPQAVDFSALSCAFAGLIILISQLQGASLTAAKSAFVVQLEVGAHKVFDIDCSPLL